MAGRRSDVPKAVIDAFSWMVPPDEDSRKSLTRALEHLAGHRVDLGAVYSVLRGAKLWKASARQESEGIRQLDRWCRRRQTLLTRVRALPEAFADLYAPLEDSLLWSPLATAGSGPRRPSRAARQASERVLAACDALLAAIEADPVLSARPRRPEGHQPEPWIAQADRALRAAGVRDLKGTCIRDGYCDGAGCRTELLNLVGLKRRS